MAMKMKMVLILLFVTRFFKLKKKKNPQIFKLLQQIKILKVVLSRSRVLCFRFSCFLKFLPCAVPLLL